MTNRLANSQSPYLEQHAQNPVDWYPWGEEALECARKQNKPILLSIGYSACHWCHVMAHESFEDEATAALMNHHFINIKVDREQRPDLDKIYQTAHYIISEQSGGWPLTIFLNPHDLMPFYSGTYFPIEPRYGIPGFKNLLQELSDFYHQNTDKLQIHRQQLQNVFAAIDNNQQSDEDINLSVINSAIDAIMSQHDRIYGGFGQAPKFPHVSDLEFLILTKNENIALFTLTKMARGGIFDHLSGGFYRYSTDQFWQIPHFEKMLYDNGLLLYLYSYASLFDHQLKPVVKKTANWIISQMQDPKGGFYASIDADSEGIEGKYYTFTDEELDQLLNAKEYQVAAEYFGFSESPNFEHAYHFYQHDDIKDISYKYAISIDEVQQTLESAIVKLQQKRSQRIPPLCDQKLLISWNGLMIKGLASAGKILKNSTFISSAKKALDYIKKSCWDGSVLYCDHAIFLDDYVFLIDAIFEYLQAEWNTDYLNWACALTNSLIENFYDDDRGGFYFTSHQHEQLISRPKPLQDESIPAGNAIAARVLIKLGYLLGETTYLDLAIETIKIAWNQINRIPQAHSSFLSAITEYLTPIPIYILRGQENIIKEKSEEILQRDNLRQIIFAISDEINDLPPSLQQKVANKNQCMIYKCSGMKCELVENG